MRTQDRERLCRRIPILFILVIAASRPVRAETPPAGPDGAVPADGWQRGLEIGGLAATIFTIGCGGELLARMDGDGRSYSIPFGTHLALHAASGAAAISLNLAAGWQQWEINRHREKLEFRHYAHNVLFWTSLSSLAASAILGFAGTQAGSRTLDLAMEDTGYASLFISLADVVLFGGRDNGTIIGDYKLGF